jgi:ferrous iron transport protein A
VNVSLSKRDESRFVDLCQAQVGLKLRVRDLRSQPIVCQRLREMGFCELAEICKLSDAGALLCLVCGTKVALSRKLGKEIIVEPVHARSDFDS